MISNDEEIQQAVSVLLHSGNYSQSVQPPLPDISHSYSINTITSVPAEYVINEHILAGQILEGRMSSVRRFFCLFVTFDLAFTGLMWLICIMLTGQSISTAIDKQIYHYTIHTSLFDVVIAGVCRFVLLILFYGLIRINHWIMIALSTTATCAFLIFKVFQYNWVDSHQPVFEVLLILTSFVISWGEAWFLDFKVLPQELNARRILINSPQDERTPLIRSYLQGLNNVQTESVGNFYSPLCSPESSIYEGLNNPLTGNLEDKLSKEQINNYKIKAMQLLEESQKIINHPDWTFKKNTSENDTLHILNLPKIGKLFKISGRVKKSPLNLINDLYFNVEEIPSWYSDLLESHILQTINSNTDIIHQITCSDTGPIKSREFVNLRHYSSFDNYFIIVYGSIDYPFLSTTNTIRGENKFGCWITKPVLNNPNECELQWILNVNLNGWIPNYLIDAGIVKSMTDCMQQLRIHLSDTSNHESVSCW